jgi:CheY-like chemotaxis protein
MDRRRGPNALTRPLVLVVNGHEDTRELYALGLSVLGFDTAVVEHQAHAFDRARALHPDVIVTDLPVRGDDGWTLLRRIKQDPQTHDIPVVVVSGHVQGSFRDRAERDGCSAFFLKPCLPDELAARLRQVLDEENHVRAAD